MVVPRLYLRSSLKEAVGQYSQQQFCSKCFAYSGFILPKHPPLEYLFLRECPYVISQA